MENNNIELRSEKVRNLIGAIPSKTVNYGITIISIIVFILILSLLYIPYPRNLESDCYISSNDVGEHYFESIILYEYINTIQVGFIAQIEMEGYQHQKYGFIQGEIISIANDIIEIDGKNYFTIKVKPSDNKAIKLRKGMKGVMLIRINDSSVLGYIIKSNSKTI